ncbi:hypothetical protein, partial [Microtetraspora malaysiensis]|uniref:hypothetical protein n=1 Tax=Microtetraspora malaysiensis TaxID=161358 RepID=UPI001C3F463E
MIALPGTMSGSATAIKTTRAASRTPAATGDPTRALGTTQGIAGKLTTAGGGMKALGATRRNVARERLARALATVGSMVGALGATRTDAVRERSAVRVRVAGAPGPVGRTIGLPAMANSANKDRDTHGDKARRGDRDRNRSGDKHRGGVRTGRRPAGSSQDAHCPGC